MAKWNIGGWVRTEGETWAQDVPGMNMPSSACLNIAEQALDLLEELQFSMPKHWSMRVDVLLDSCRAKPPSLRERVEAAVRKALEARGLDEYVANVARAAGEAAEQAEKS